MVEADLFNIDSLVHAFTGAYAVFAVTNYWDPTSKGKELELGKNMVNAAKKTNIQHFIWSSLPNAIEYSKGKFTKKSNILTTKVK